MAPFINDNGELEDFPSGRPQDDMPWKEALETLLAPYMPARSVAGADAWMTTPEILSQLEQHFTVPQSDPLGQSIRPISGSELVRELEAMGFTAANIGGGGLYWLLARRIQ